MKTEGASKRLGRWKWLAGGLAAAILIVAGAWAARPADARPWGGHGEMMMGLGGILHGLDLTTDQKHQIAGILRNHKSELLAAREKMATAGRAMMRGMMDQEAKPDALQARVDAAADAGKQLGRVMIGIRSEAMAVLTSAQKQELAKRHEKFLARMEKHMGEHKEDREQNIDELIERLSK